jgi:hypothetical protein
MDNLENAIELFIEKRNGLVKVVLGKLLKNSEYLSLTPNLPIILRKKDDVHLRSDSFRLMYTKEIVNDGEDIYVITEDDSRILLQDISTDMLITLAYYIDYLDNRLKNATNEIYGYDHQTFTSITIKAKTETVDGEKVLILDDGYTINGIPPRVVLDGYDMEKTFVFLPDYSYLGLKGWSFFTRKNEMIDELKNHLREEIKRLQDKLENGFDSCQSLSN